MGAALSGVDASFFRHSYPLMVSAKEIEPFSRRSFLCDSSYNPPDSFDGVTHKLYVDGANWKVTATENLNDDHHCDMEFRGTWVAVSATQIQCVLTHAKYSGTFKAFSHPHNPLPITYRHDYDLEIEAQQAPPSAAPPAANPDPDQEPGQQQKQEEVDENKAATEIRVTSYVFDDHRRPGLHLHSGTHTTNQAVSQPQIFVLTRMENQAVATWETELPLAAMWYTSRPYTKLYPAHEWKRGKRRVVFGECDYQLVSWDTFR
eukprot:TRINITY_DN3736_c0_g1_i4.p1 TRINITY_DN3736_c0_g1~~TRINITY_DN3736_c0_g1_i4.p1  ORF type:complete len:261 (+),score=42.05 TRINITY_DN3736_c0_g1_i4:136-918(+)